MEIFYLSSAALLTSMLSALVGMGGGILLLAIMSLFLPPALIIPLHGVVQWSSNTLRFTLNFKHLDWTIIRPYCVGALIGAMLGQVFVVQLPPFAYFLSIGAFILFATWLKLPAVMHRGRLPFFTLGVGATFISLFVGATGPIQAPFFLQRGLKPRAIIGTKALVQSVTHLLKTFIFVGAGFQLGSHLDLIFAMVPCVFVGTWLGTYLLKYWSLKSFHFWFRLILSALALRMIYLGVNHWMTQM